MKTLVFASNNAHKLDEIRAILAGLFDVRSLADIGCHDDIPETGSTFRENALQKARYVKEHYGYDCFADDSGLQVDALGGEPGVYSARYAAMHGQPATPTKDQANINCLLARLNGTDQTPLGWTARFRTSIALLMDGQEHFFDGTVEGHIIAQQRGQGGFGYDPIFIPQGYDQTFAELGAEVKNGISHRARAVAQLADFLSQKKELSGS